MQEFSFFKSSDWAPAEKLLKTFLKLQKIFVTFACFMLPIEYSLKAERKYCLKGGDRVYGLP